jgi:hypothetical protein
MKANFEIPEEGLELFLASIRARKENCVDGTVFSIIISLDTDKDERECTSVEVMQYGPDYTVTKHSL